MAIYEITKREKCQSSFDQIRLYKAKCFGLNRKRHNFELLANIVLTPGDEENYHNNQDMKISVLKIPTLNQFKGAQFI